MLGKLYLVATPIGNLQDISLRALEVLKTVDIIACEDTRHTGRMLKHFSIYGKLISYHDHNEDKRSDELVEYLQIGKSIALVSDAGTPGISDPGFRLVSRAREAGAEIVPVPGAVAFVNALIVSGLPTDTFLFGGFLPAKKTERKTRLRELATVDATLCFYETPRRIAKSLSDCAKVLGNRPAMVARELTKLHEDYEHGTLEELAERFGTNQVKGELVVVIDRPGAEAGNSDEEESVYEMIKSLESSGVERKKALKKAAKEFGLSKSEAYRIFQEFS